MILEASRMFRIDKREFEFDENEAIFFVTKAKSSNELHNTKEGCNTCGARWLRASDL